MENIMDPVMIKRQILLIKQRFSDYPQDDQDTDARVAEAIESGLYPLVNHIVLFRYPEFDNEVLKLSKFPHEKEYKDKWLNEFSLEVGSGRMFYDIVFTQKDADSIHLSLPEMLNALNAIKIAVPFFDIKILDFSIIGEIYFSAKCMEKESVT